MKKNIIPIVTVLSVALFLGGLFVLGRGRTGAPPKEPKAFQVSLPSVLAASEPAYDFGTISMAHGKVQYAFAVRNTSAEPIELERLYTSCMCTTVRFMQGGAATGPFGMPGHGFVPPLKKMLQPGEEATLEVTFDPAAHGPAGIGKIERTVRLEPKAGAPVEFAIAANVIP